MMSIPARFMDEIRNRLTLSEIIGKRIRLTRAGREMKGCCPFHKEKTPSFTVNDDKQFYHCFGCGAHGDVIGFVMQHDNLSFIDAVESLAALAGLQVPKPSPEEAKRAEEARDLYKLMDAAARWFQEQLYSAAHRDVLSYLKQARGLSAATLSAFRIGFAPDERQQLRTYLKEQGYSDADMISAGLVKKSDKSEQPYVFFRERVIFPVSDRRGRIVALGGRALPDHMRAPSRDGFTPAKYINSPDTPLFDKGRMVYGEAQARMAARDGAPVIVTEGYMDVIACHQAGFKGAIAPMGTALTEAQIITLWKMIPADEKMPVLCFDGDNAGRQAAARACARVLPLLGPGRSVKFAFMPQGEDPDSLLRSGAAAQFQAVLDGASSLFDYLWAAHMEGKDLRVPEIRAQVSDGFETQIRGIADRDVQRHYQELLRGRISEYFFQPRFRPIKNSMRGGRLPAAAVKPRAPGFRDMNARIFMTTILNYPDVFDACEEAFGCFPIENARLDALRQAIIAAMAEEKLDYDALRTHLVERGFQKEMNDISGDTVYIHAAFSRPGRDSALAAEGLFLWLAEIQGRNWQDINQGWKKAFEELNENEEDRVRAQAAAKLQDHH